MRGFYEVNPETFCQTIDHLLGMAHVTVERWEAVKDACPAPPRRGLDFADALHWVCSAACGQFVTFDDRGFVRRAQALKLVPEVAVPRRA